MADEILSFLEKFLEIDSSGCICFFKKDGEFVATFDNGSVVLFTGKGKTLHLAVANMLRCVSAGQREFERKTAVKN